MIDKMREEFEVWAGEYLMYEPESVRRNWDGTRYAHDALNGMWDGWKASRESLVIDIPDAEIGCSDESCGFNRGVSATVEAIEAAGVKWC